MRHVQFLVLSITVALAVWIAGAPGSVRAFMPTATEAGIDDLQKRPPVVDRTSPLLQKMTAAQRHHSQMFDEFSSGSRLLDELANLNLFRQRAVSSVITKSQWDVAKELRCAADQVFIGTVEGSQSLPIADGTFLFTEYTVVVTEAIVPAPEDGGRAGTRVTVLRPGGSIRVEETTITAFISDVPRLETGASYLFFEKGVPATGATRSAHVDGTFAVSNDTVKSLASLQTLEGDLAKGTRKALFLNAVRAVGPCK